MKMNFLHCKYFQWLFIFFIIFQIPNISNGQNLKISDFVIFGGDGSCTGTGCGIQKVAVQ